MNMPPPFNKFGYEKILNLIHPLYAQVANKPTDNESFNGIVWTRCPKRVYVTRKTLEIGVNSGIIEFNEGKTGIEKVMKKAGLVVGHLQSLQNDKVLKRHTVTIRRKSSSPVKRQRKNLRAVRKNWSDKK